MKKLLVWAGPVASGKSSAALSYATRLQRTGVNVVLIRPACSLRKNEKPGLLVTKSGYSWPCEEVASALEIERAIPSVAHAVWIDLSSRRASPALQGRISGETGPACPRM